MLFEEDTQVWYAKIGVLKPISCAYLGPVEVDIGGFSDRHVVRFAAGNLMAVAAGTLYASEQRALEVLGDKPTNRVQELEMYIAMSQFELKELRGD